MYKPSIPKYFSKRGADFYRLLRQVTECSAYTNKGMSLSKTLPLCVSELVVSPPSTAWCFDLLPTCLPSSEQILQQRLLRIVRSEQKVTK